MKKIISLALCLIMLAALFTACSDPNAHPDDNPDINLPGDDVISSPDTTTATPETTPPPAENEETLDPPPEYIEPDFPVSIKSSSTPHIAYQYSGGQLISTIIGPAIMTTNNTGVFLCKIPDCNHNFNTCPSRIASSSFLVEYDGGLVVYAVIQDRDASKDQGSTQMKLVRYDAEAGERIALCDLPTSKVLDLMIYGDTLYYDCQLTSNAMDYPVTFYVNKKTGGEPVRLFGDKPYRLKDIVDDHYIYYKYDGVNARSGYYCIAPMSDPSAEVKLDEQKAWVMYSYQNIIYSIGLDLTVYRYDTADLANPTAVGSLKYFITGETQYCVGQDGRLYYSTQRYVRDNPTETVPAPVMCFNPVNGRLAEVKFPEDSIVTADYVLAVDNNIMYVCGNDKTDEFWVISMDLATKEIVMYQKGLGINLNR